MRVWIDQRACVGNGVCAELAHEVLVFDGEYAYVRDGGRVLTDPGAMATVPRGLEDAVLDAAEECPAACIYVEDA
jgi:ferredoxin